MLFLLDLMKPLCYLCMLNFQVTTDIKMTIDNDNLIILKVKILTGVLIVVKKVLVYIFVIKKTYSKLV